MSTGDRTPVRQAHAAPVYGVPAIAGTGDALLIFTHDSKPRVGGIGEYLHKLAGALAEEYRVLILTTVRGAEVCNSGLPFAYREVLTHAEHDGAGRVARMLRTAAWRGRQWLGARSALGEVLEEGPTRFVLLGIASPAAYPWARACQRIGARYGVMAYGRELVAPLGPLGQRQRRSILRHAARVISISSETTALLIEMGVEPERITVVPPGIDAAEITMPAAHDRARVRARSGVGDRPFILSLCRLTPRKGIDLAIEAFAAVAGDFPRLCHVIAGAGGEEARLRALAIRLGVERRVYFLGEVDEPTKHALFAECELFVMPNRRLPDDVEGFGIVFLEAALFGKAVIGGRNGGVVDAVEDGTTGLLVETGRGMEQVAAALRDLLSDPDRRSGMGDRGRSRALEEFAWSRTPRALLNVLNRLPEQS